MVGPVLFSSSAPTPERKIILLGPDTLTTSQPFWFPHLLKWYPFFLTLGLVVCPDAVGCMKTTEKNAIIITVKVFRTDLSSIPSSLSRALTNLFEFNLTHILPATEPFLEEEAAGLFRITRSVSGLTASPEVPL